MASCALARLRSPRSRHIIRTFIYPCLTYRSIRRRTSKPLSSGSKPLRPTSFARASMCTRAGRTTSCAPLLLCWRILLIRGVEPGPLFRFKNNSLLTREALVREVRAALQWAWVDPTSYSGHSFRSGAASTAAAAGVQDSLIKILGRWQSPAYQLYVQFPRESLASVSSRLANN